MVHLRTSKHSLSDTFNFVPLVGWRCVNNKLVFRSFLFFALLLMNLRHDVLCAYM